MFSTEVDTCDAILFMLSTSLSQDFYKRFTSTRPPPIAQLLRVARMIAVAGGIAGVVLAIVPETVIGALSVFYSLLGVTLFVPMLGGLVQPRAPDRPRRSRRSPPASSRSR